MTDFQRPALIPREAGDQASWMAVAYTAMKTWWAGSLR